MRGMQHTNSVSMEREKESEREAVEFQWLLDGRHRSKEEAVLPHHLSPLAT